HLGTLFAGVPISQVNAANTNTTSLDTGLRIQRSSQYLDLFQQSDASYSRQLTRQADATNSDLENQLKNTLAFEGGLLPRLYSRTKEIPDLKALVSVRLETQFAPPLTSFKLATSPPVLLKEKTSRTKALLGKYGLRFQNEKS